MGKIINFLFIGTVLAIYLIPDDETCQKYTSSESCERRRSIDVEETLCLWDDEINSCSANEEGSATFKATALICLLINVFVGPLDAMLRYFIRPVKTILIRRNNKLRFKTLGVYDDQDYIDTKNTLSAAERAGSIGDNASEAKLKCSTERSSDSVRDPTLLVYSSRVRQEKLRCESYRKGNYEKGDLWRTQTVLSKAICAMRLSMMRIAIDNVDLPTEIALIDSLREQRKNRELLSLAGINGAICQFSTLTTIAKRNIISDMFFSLSENVYNRPFFIYGTRVAGFDAKLRSNVVTARIKASDLIQILERFPDDDYRDVHLLRSFFVDCLAGYRKSIASRFFFAESLLSVDTLPDEKGCHTFWGTTYCYVCAIMIPAYLLALCFYIFLFGVQVGQKSTNLWLLTISISLFEDLVVIEPLYLFVSHVIVANAVYKDIVILTRRVLGRSKTIMRRVSGQLNPSISYIQHVSPACRAARKFPRLFISRLLISINDSDIPATFMTRYDSSHLLKRLYLLCRGLLILSFVSLIPEVAQETVLEVLSSIVVNSVFVGVTFAALGSISAVFQVIVAFGNLLLLALLFYFLKSFLRWWRARSKVSGHRKEGKVNNIYNRKVENLDLEMAKFHQAKVPVGGSDNFGNADSEQFTFLSPMNRKKSDICTN